MVRKNYEHTYYYFGTEPKHSRIFIDSRIKYETDWMDTSKKNIKRKYIISHKTNPELYTIEMLFSNDMGDFTPIGVYNTFRDAMIEMQFILSGAVDESYSDMRRKKYTKPKCVCNKRK